MKEREGKKIASSFEIFFFSPAAHERQNCDVVVPESYERIITKQYTAALGRDKTGGQKRRRRREGEEGEGEGGEGEEDFLLLRDLLLLPLIILIFLLPILLLLLLEIT